MSEMEFVKQFAVTVYCTLTLVGLIGCVWGVVRKEYPASTAFLYGALGWGTAAVLILRGIVQ